MLRKIRIVLAVICFAAITLLFLDFTGVAHAWFGWLATIQFLPAVLALHLVAVVVWLAVTLLVGRVYCSIICPLGVMQDIVSWANGRRGRKHRNRFTYSKEKQWLRYGVLAVFVAAVAGGVGTVVALLAPYSSFGRIASNLLQPLYRWGNNLLALIAEHMDSYTFYSTDVWLKSLPTFLIALATFIIIGVLAWRNGRTYCNTICPVGTMLGLFSRFCLIHPRIDKDKCKNCGLCTRQCKASAIDFKNGRIDLSRCVACMDCLESCKHGAISLRPLKGEKEKKSEEQEVLSGRRSFLLTSLAVASTAALHAQEKKVDGGLAIIEDKVKPERATPLVPAGAVSLRNFGRHCTGCQLCVSACPNNVLRPSTDLMTLMQPEMSYERGYCRPECTRCSDVCPAGAIRPISISDKSSTRIGHAVWVKKNCVPLTDGVDCGNCARHCPSGAIQMVPSDPNDETSIQIPVVNTERCIGCGACENLCPARPFSAIYVEGHSVHSTY